MWGWVIACNWCTKWNTYVLLKWSFSCCAVLKIHTEGLIVFVKYLSAPNYFSVLFLVYVLFLKLLQLPLHSKIIIILSVVCLILVKLTHFSILCKLISNMVFFNGFYFTPFLSIFLIDKSNCGIVASVFNYRSGS